MSAIAETLRNWNYKVTGSDLNKSNITDNLNKHGIPTVVGHDLENAKNADLIIYSAAISDKDPEILTALENNVPIIGRGDFVGYLTKLYKEAICVSGTHGKTTTTSMLSNCFIDAQKDPSIDYYKTFDNVVKAFNDFAQIVEPDGLVVVNGDDKNCFEIKDIVRSKFISYGIENENCNFLAENIKFDENGFAIFDVYKNKEFYEHFELSVAGKHNILNALACISTCDYYNISKEVIQSSLKKFTGAERRLEFKGKLNGNVSIFDDYAHHPTEIKATSTAVKNKKYNESWVIFQPHTYSRTKNHLDDFADSLIDFDNIIILDIYAAREKNTFNISSEDLVEKIASKGKNSIYLPDFDDVVSYIKSNVKENDIIITLGAGTVTQIGPMILK